MAGWNYAEIKKRTYEILEKGSIDDKPSFFFDMFIIILIVLNVIVIVLESFRGIYVANVTAFRTFELFSVAVFTVEYILRVWTADYHVKARSKRVARMKYIFSPLAVIDLLAILPFYLPLVTYNLLFLRALRLIRLFRLFKLGRYLVALYLIKKVIEAKRGELLVTLFASVLFMLISGSLIYLLEGNLQPEAFPNILAGIWWTIANATTIDFGNIAPVTIWGKVLASFVAVVGLGLIALPAGIISSGFMQELKQENGAGETEESESGSEDSCPCCGKPFNSRQSEG